MHEIIAFTCIRVGEMEKLGAGVQVGESPDAKAVGWVKLSYEKLTAGLFHLLQLEQTSGGQQHLNTQTHKLQRTFNVFAANLKQS